MKLAGLLLMSLVVGLAYAQDPDKSTTSTEESQATAATNDQSAAPQTAEQQTAASGTETAADGEQGKPVDIVALQNAGYKLVNRSGVQVFCKKEPILGSRLRYKTRCLTAAEIERESFAARDAMNDVSRKTQNLHGD